VLGEYTAKTDGVITLEIGQVEYQFGDSEVGYRWDASIRNESGSPSVRFAYNDLDNETSSVTVDIINKSSGAVVDTATFDDGPYGEIVYSSPITQDEYNNETFVVEWEAERGGEVISGSQTVGSRALLDFPLDRSWMNIGFALVVFILAFVVGAGINPGAGAVTVSMWSGVAWYLGIVPTELGAGAIILAIAISGWMLINQDGQGVPR